MWAQEALCDWSDIDTELDELQREIEVVVELSRKVIYENAHTVIDQDEWYERNNSYLERHRKAPERVSELESLKRERQSKSLMIEGFVQNLEGQQEALEEFDDRLWIVAIETVTVQQDGKLYFVFKDGTKFTK